MPRKNEKSIQGSTEDKIDLNSEYENGSSAGFIFKGILRGKFNSSGENIVERKEQEKVHAGTQFIGVADKTAKIDAKEKNTVKLVKTENGYQATPPENHLEHGSNETKRRIIANIGSATSAKRITGNITDVFVFDGKATDLVPTVNIPGSEFHDNIGSFTLVKEHDGNVISESHIYLRKSSDPVCQLDAHVSIFNQSEDRPGSEYDVERLTETFQKRGVQPTVHQNLGYIDTILQIESLAKADFSQRKLFVLIHMSHGSTNGTVSAADSNFSLRPIIIDRIMRNSTLNNIPKVFVIVACRGSERYYKGRDSIEKCEDGDGLPDVNFLGAGAIAPYIFSYSTLEGLVSYRNSGSGTYFVQALCDEIDKSNGDTTLPSIFTNVNHELMEKLKVQVPVFHNAMGNIRFKDLAPNSS